MLLICYKKLKTVNLSSTDVMNRTSFCCYKKLEKIAFIFNESCKKLHLCTNIKNDSDLLKRFVYIYNAKCLQTLLREKWRFFANSLLSMLKLRFTVNEVVSKPLRHR